MNLKKYLLTIFLFTLFFALGFASPRSLEALENLSVTVSSPVDGEVVPRNFVTVTAEATPGSTLAPITAVDFLVNDQLLATDTEYPYEVDWNTIMLVPGTYQTLKAVAHDSESATAISQQVTVQIQPNTQAPVVAIYMPENNSIVPRDSLVLIRARAIDNYQVRNVVFFVDGAKICNETDDNPFTYYSCLWVTPKKKNVVYTLTARAYDPFGNFSTYSIQVTAR